MFSFIIQGGSPIYRRGLFGLLDHFFPQNSFLLDAEGQDSTLAADLAIYVLPQRLQLAAICELADQSVQEQVLWIGDYLSLRQVKVLLAGQGAYLLRDSKPLEFKRAITAIIAGEIYIDGQLRDCWLNRQLRLQTSPSLTPLSKREQQVVQLIVTEMTTCEIAKELFLSPCTVENHRANILHKLGARNTAGIVREALRLKLVENH